MEEIKNNIDFNLSTIQNGSINEKFNIALESVIKNAMDENTDPAAKRKIQITLTMKTTDNRDVLMTGVVVKTTLAPQREVRSTIAIGRDSRGVATATEIGSQSVGQQYVDLDTGEIKTLGSNLVNLQDRA